MSHTTYDNAHLFHGLTKALTKCRKTHFPGHPLLCTTSFKSIISPQKACSFRTKLCPFPCLMLLILILILASYYCHSQWSIWGVEDIPGHRESLHHHHGATKSWGLASLAMGLAPLTPITSLMRAASAAQSMITSWFDSFLAALH